MKLLLIFLSMAVSGCVTTTQRRLDRDVYLLKYRVKKLEKMVEQLEGDVTLLNSMPPEGFHIPMPDVAPIPKQKPKTQAPAPKAQQVPQPKAPASPVKRP